MSVRASGSGGSIRCAALLVQVLLLLLCWSPHFCFPQVHGADAGHCQKVPVFLKFHKVGGASIARTLAGTYLRIGGSGGYGTRNWWYREAWLEDDDPAADHYPCGTAPWVHDTMKIYRKYGQEGLFHHCLAEEYEAHCLPSDLVVTAILREPLEKAVSQMFFFPSHFVEPLAVVNESSPAHLQMAKAAVEKIFTARHSLTGEEMGHLLDFIQQHSYILSEEDGIKIHEDISVMQYEYFLSRAKKGGPNQPFASTNATLALAVQNLNEDVGAVGVMEHFPAYWTLLSLKLNTSLPCSCLAHFDHGDHSKENKKVFGSDHRPPVAEIFPAEVVAAMRQKLGNEVSLYEEATRVHEQQLSQFGLTVQQATDAWTEMCTGLGEAHIMALHCKASSR
jgi:hypothetical protein